MYNQLARQYTRPVRVIVPVSTIKVVRKIDGREIPAQINPVVVAGGILAPDIFEVLVAHESERI